MARRSKNNLVAAKLMTYLTKSRGLTQSEIASILQVDKSFVSRVAAGQRDLSTYQLRQLADAQNLPLGAMLLAALENSKPSDPKLRKIQELAADLVRLADNASMSARARSDTPRKSKRCAG